MKNQGTTKKTTDSVQKKGESNNKPKTTSRSLSSKNKKTRQTRKNTRGKQINQNPFVNFEHLQELCRDNGCMNVEINAEIARCINECSSRKKLQFSTTPAIIGKYRRRICGIRSDNLACLTLCLGNNINPEYLIEGGSGIKIIPKKSKITIDPKTGEKKEAESIDTNALFLLLRNSVVQKRVKKIEPIIKISSILGYSIKEIDEKIYLQIPEEKKKTLHFDYANMENGMPLTDSECEYLVTQLESVLNLFEQTLLNYYSSNMAFENMIDRAAGFTWTSPDIAEEEAEEIKNLFTDNQTEKNSK